MADLTADEASDFQSTLARLEPALESAFGALLINMAYQRNWAYRGHQPDPPLLDEKPNPHVHWHITPRYDRPIVFAGLTFDDPTFGEPYEWRDRPVPTTVRVAIIDRIRVHLNIDLVAAEEM